MLTNLLRKMPNEGYQTSQSDLPSVGIEAENWDNSQFSGFTPPPRQKNGNLNGSNNAFKKTKILLKQAFLICCMLFFLSATTFASKNVHVTNTGCLVLAVKASGYFIGNVYGGQTLTVTHSFPGEYIRIENANGTLAASYVTGYSTHQYVNVNSGGCDPCAGQGGDSDGDGVCANKDCDDHNPNIGAQKTPGTACNDGDPNTANDVIQADGCTCAGTPIDPCVNNDFTIDCEKNINFEGWQIVNNCIVTVCKGDHVVISVNPNGYPTSWIGPNGLTSNSNNLLISSSIDFNQGGTYIATINKNGCEKSKTIQVIVENCDPCIGQGGDNDNDGVCGNVDCDDNNPNVGAQQTPGTACNDGNPNTTNDVIQADGCTCKGTPIDPCIGQGGDNDNDGVCGNVDCDDNNPNVGAQQTPGTACNDGNPNTTNDVIQADGCTCKGTPIDPCIGQGGDNDNDGVCGNVDCDDNNPNVGAQQTPGTACNDGNPNTTNDVIQADGCTCKGTPIDPCIGQGGDNDNDGVCGNVDCDDFDPTVGNPQTPGTACNDGNPNTINDVIQSDGCTCAGVPSGPDPDCDDITFSGGSKITLNNLTAPIVIVKVFNSSWQQVAGCNNNCNVMEMYNLPAGTYYVSVKFFNASWQLICQRNEYVTITGTDPCAGSGGDNDDDGVCGNVDCDDFDPSVGNPQTPGTACNDGNPNTTNDVIQSDGCTCAGTPIGPCDNQGGDHDGDGVCANQDCDDFNANIGAQQTPGTACNDGNPNTTNDVIQSDGCTCQGTPIGNPCDGQGGDHDGDGVCANQDCDDFNANIGAQQTPGTACNDGNPNTSNDQIQADGCTCQGTPTGGGNDCEDVVITTSSGSITVSGLNAPIVIIKVFDSSWQTVFECSNNCNTTEVISGLAAEQHCVQIKYFTSSWSLICDRLECVTVPGGGGGCDNLTSGGTIGFGNDCSNTYNGGTCPINPPSIRNCQSPSGGSGTIEYIWLQSTTSSNPPTTTIANIINDPHWSIISGATSSTYDPGNISQTTYYLRCARRSGCTRYLGESNIIAAMCTSGGGSNISLSCPNNITVTQTSSSGAVVSWNTPNATTSCSGGASVSQTGGLSSGSTFPVGTTQVSYTATDNCGGSVSCSFTVTVNENNGGGGMPTGYCSSKGSSPWHEWIKKVQFGNINNSSSKEGYGDFTHLGTTLSKGQSYNITLEPGFSWTQYTEHWRVWIDFNRDGDFDDAGEKVVEAQSAQIVQASISIPASAASGVTRMRISMNRDQYAGPCMQFTNGEVEDYAVTIGNNVGDMVDDRSSNNDNNTLKAKEIQVYPNPSNGLVQLNLSAFEGETMDIRVYNQIGQLIQQQTIEAISTAPFLLDLKDVDKGVYFIHLQAKDETPMVKKLIISNF